MYDVAVHMSKHPDLNAYVSDSVALCRTLLRSGSLERLLVVVAGEDGGAVERYCLDVRVCRGHVPSSPPPSPLPYSSLCHRRCEPRLPHLCCATPHPQCLCSWLPWRV